MSEDNRYLCTSCYGGTVPLARLRLGRTTCLPCGEALAKKVKHIIAPLNKSNYMVFTDVSLLKQLNPKRT